MVGALRLHSGGRQAERSGDRYFRPPRNALMVKGADFTLRLRQIHDQIMVLRGAAFNGVEHTLAVHRLGRGAKAREARLVAPPGRRGGARSLLCGCVDRHGSPFPRTRAPELALHEITLLLLALVGAWLVWKPPSSAKAEEARARKQGPEKRQNRNATGGVGTGRGLQLCPRFYDRRRARMVVNRGALRRTGRLLVRSQATAAAQK